MTPYRIITPNHSAQMRLDRCLCQCLRLRPHLLHVLLVTVIFAQPVAAQNADVGVTVYAPNLDVITNDWMPYTIMVTNNGPGAAQNVTATTTLPSNFGLIDASPSYSLAGNVLTFNFGTLTNLAARFISVRARPTNSGAFNLTATVSSSVSTDLVSANNSSSAGISVGTYLPGTLTVSLVSTQKYNPQTGLLEQAVQLSNAGPSAVPSARIVVSGTTSTNYTYFAAGTNSGKQFVLYPLPLEPMQTVNLVLQFYSSTRTLVVSNLQFQAYPTVLASLNPPGVLGANIPITKVLRLSTGYTMIEYPSLIGSNYTILYSDDPAFTKPKAVPASITAPADVIQWIDHGPPLTTSTPTPPAPRYYRVFINPT